MKHHSKSGFTLIELIMTIIVVAIVAIPSAISVAEYIQGAVEIDERALVVNLARHQMAEVINTDYNSLNSASFSSYLGYNYDVDRVVSYAFGGAASAESLKLIVVTVTPGGSGQALTSLQTYRADNVTYGL